MTSPSGTSEMYVYNLPYNARKELCRILDQNDKWEELGGAYMGFDVITLQNIRREVYIANGAHQWRSPTEELLTLWGHRNHTVLELFILLRHMHHYQSMMTLKQFISPKYHCLIDEGKQNLSNLLQKLKDLNKNDTDNKDLKIAEENFNDSCKVLNKDPTSKERRNSNNARAELASQEDNESVVDNNNYLKPADDPQSRRKSIEVDMLSASSKPLLYFQISYDELSAATHNWDPSTILGKGGFGTVFKGTWKCTLVAIKRIEEKEDSPDSNNIQLQQSLTELNCLNAYRHDNILPLYGCSLSGLQPCLVYQYMPGGNLEQRLRVRDLQKQLQWSKRLHIATGVARGLQFLHTIGEKPLIHGDIKPANILLDQNDEPKIGDFGLARQGPQSDYTHIKVSRLHGTRPYLPDEFLRSKKLSTKLDTYCYGVVMFEIATGLGPYNDSRPNKFLRDHVINYEGDITDLMDRRVGSENSRYYLHFIEIGKVCVSKRAKDRPEMKTVLLNLEEIKNLIN